MLCLVERNRKEEDKMNILFISHEGDSLGLAMRCRSEGHPTHLYISKEEAGCVGDGLIDKPLTRRRLKKLSGDCIATNIDELLKEVKPDLVVFDSVGFGKVADYLRERGIAVFGSSFWSDTLITSTDYGKQMMKRLNVDVVSGEEYVVLWNGTTIVSSFLIRNETRLMTGSLGLNVDSVGNVMIEHSPKKYDELSERVEKLLKKVKFRGILSIGKKFDVSVRYLPLILETYKGSIADFLFSIASCKNYEGEVTSDYAVSILLSIPPYPYQPPSKSVSIEGVNECNLKHLHLIDVAKPSADGEYETAEASGRVGWVTARGRSVKEAKKRAYITISNLRIQDVQYRLDVGN